MEDLSTLPIQELTRLASQYHLIDHYEILPDGIYIREGSLEHTFEPSEAMLLLQGLIRGHLRVVQSLG